MVSTENDLKKMVAAQLSEYLDSEEFPRILPPDLKDRIKNNESLANYSLNRLMTILDFFKYGMILSDGSAISGIALYGLSGKGEYQIKVNPDQYTKLLELVKSFQEEN